MTPDSQSKEEVKIEFAKLPVITDLDCELRARVRELLQELDQINAEKLQLTIRRDDIEEDLELIQRRTGRTGFRDGPLVFCSQPVKGRRTLDRTMLLENGCTAAIINASMKTGTPSVRNTFKHLEDI